MEKRSSSSPPPPCDGLTSSLEKLKLNRDDSFSNKRLLLEKTVYQRPIASNRKNKCPSLVNLCLGLLGKHFEDIIEDLSEITVSFPPNSKMALMAIARRRKLLNDDVLISLTDSCWDLLDISGSDVSDHGLTEVVNMCVSLRAVDVSKCSRITAIGVSELLSNCHLLETLRCGGCPRSDAAIRRCLGILKPKFDDVAGESWEELDSKEITNGAEALRWLLWPNIDDNSRETLATECPRIVVNPIPSPFSFRGFRVPTEAIADIVLDDSFVQDIDPKTWAVPGVAPRVLPSVSGLVPRVVPLSNSSHSEMPIAERFRLAFVERDVRLAPKRAKNVRQHRRRAEREWMTTDTDAKSVVLASKLSKSLHSRT